ncbi:MAG: glycerophosphodiester phosphodiesterase [Angustibacter sp.]
MSARLVHPYLDVDVPFGMAHRGFSLDGLENTMPAFAAAVSLGVSHVETDVHATKDGVLVTFHDDRLDRLTDGHGPIADHTWDQLRRHVRVRGVEPIPRLDELLDTWPDLRVNIDVKAWSAVPALAQVLTRTRALDRVCIASFDDRRIAAVRAGVGSGSRLAISSGRLGITRWRLLSMLPGRIGARYALPADPWAVVIQAPRTLGPLPVVTRRSVRVAHDHGLQVHVWTVNDPSGMRQLLDLGVDSIITDRPDLFLQVRAEREPRRADPDPADPRRDQL